MLKCKACGADIPFIPESQNYICPYCDTVHTHEELTAQEQAGEIAAEEHVMEVQAEDPAKEESNHMHVYVYTCPQCGGELLTTEETYATFCSYCGSSVILQKREGEELKPDYIIPFAISQKEAADIYHKTMKDALFAPSYMQNMDIEKIRGIYMPYWTYDGDIRGTVTGKEIKRTKKKGGTQIDTYSVNANVHINGNGIEFDSSSAFPDDLSQAVGPFKFKTAKPFTADYMSGFYADRGDVKSDVYAEAALQTLLDVGKKTVAKKTGIEERAQNFNINRGLRSEKALYPVWFVSARNRLENRVSYAVINGQTGKIAADIPVDPLKLLKGTAIATIPLFLLFYLLLVPTPLVTAIVTAALSIIGLCITLAASHNTKQSFTLSCLLNVAAVLLCFALMFINPFRDEIYYGGIILADALCMLSYIIVFMTNNKQMLRSLPQLGKRGGDENGH